MTPIYLDNAASTRVSDEVIALMTEVMRSAWGNPSAQHPQGAAARAYIEHARGRMLGALGDRAGAGDIVWTSGCTEADALAVLGAARTRPGPVAITGIEHPAVAATVARLDGGARDVVQVAPDASGVIDPEAFAEAAANAGVAAVVMVQNELGVVQPIAAIVAAVRRRNPACFIHVDAAQAFGKVPVDAPALGADSIAIAGHKLHGPKGTGALWLRAGVALEPLWVGGGQQKGLRGGTQDAPGAAGLGLAAERAVAALPSARAKWLELAAGVEERLAARGVAFRRLVPDQRRAPHILALGFPGVPASALRTVLASRGVYIATGSACADRDAKPSTVLAAINLPSDTGMCRLSFGHDTTADEVAQATELVATAATELAR
ncbi:MAG: aminotransferase class V-fold PLP-dependent enzyme [Deltaproteobacteria bacterium]|nr:aminotransferase class V-fold PLP-dependent enzyme [Deltaproteobacteria bacterium]